MATTYTPDPTAAQSPGVRPRVGVFPSLSLPADGDALNAASVAQAYKSLGDYIAYVNARGRFVFAENWFSNFSALTSNTDPVTNNGPWKFTINTNGTLTYVPNAYNAAIDGNTVTVSTTAGASHSAYLQGPVVLVPSANTYFMAEWYGISTAVDTGHAQVRAVGIAQANSTAGVNGVYFSNTSNSSSNWSAVAGDNGSYTTTGTGVAVGTSAQLFRIELYGANQTGGAKALFYINGSLTNTLTTNLPFTTLPPSPTTGLRLFFGVDNAASSTTATLTVGPVFTSSLVSTGQL